MMHMAGEEHAYHRVQMSKVAAVMPMVPFVSTVGLFSSAEWALGLSCPLRRDRLSVTKALRSLYDRSSRRPFLSVGAWLVPEAGRVLAEVVVA
jgi:hypothetical protein